MGWVPREKKRRQGEAFYQAKKGPPGDSIRDLFIPKRWRSPTTFEGVMFSPSQKRSPAELPGTGFCCNFLFEVFGWANSPRLRCGDFPAVSGSKGSHEMLRGDFHGGILERLRILVHP